MERLFAIGLVLLLGTTPTKADDLQGAEDQIDEIDARDPEAEAVDEVASLPVDGEDAIENHNQPPAEEPAGSLPQPNPVVSHEIESALDNLSETENVNNAYQEENSGLREEIRKLKLQQAKVQKAKPKAVKKHAKKSTKKKKYAKDSKLSKKSKKADARRVPANKKKVGASKRSTSKDRVVASNHGFATQLPKKRAP